jgi:hypothetical protein
MMFVKQPDEFFVPCGVDIVMLIKEGEKPLEVVICFPLNKLFNV